MMDLAFQEKFEALIKNLEKVSEAVAVKLIKDRISETNTRMDSLTNTVDSLKLENMELKTSVNSLVEENKILEKNGPQLEQ